LVINIELVSSVICLFLLEQFEIFHMPLSISGGQENSIKLLFFIALQKPCSNRQRAFFAGLPNQSSVWKSATTRNKNRVISNNAHFRFRCENVECRTLNGEDSKDMPQYCLCSLFATGKCFKINNFSVNCLGQRLLT